MRVPGRSAARRSSTAVVRCRAGAITTGADMVPALRSGMKNAAPGHASCCAQPLQKPRQIIGDMIDMGGVAAFQLPVLAHDILAAVRHHQHRGHAELVRDHQIARQILEHRRAFGLDVVEREKFLIGLRRGLRLQLGGDDVEHRLEMRTDAEPLQHLGGVIGRAVGQDQLASRQFRDRRAHRRIGLQAANDRSGAHRRDSRRRSRHARSSCRAWWCRSGGNSPSGSGAPRPPASSDSC